jgi:hypothetical protein
MLKIQQMKKLTIGLFGLLLICQSLTAQQIKRAEYFFDTDPGEGLGTAIAVGPADSVNISMPISIASLSVGYHNLFVRVMTMDTFNHWSLYEGRNFYIQAPVVTAPAAKIQAAEYFFDTDPGVGLGTAIASPTADSVNITNSISVNALTPGFHNLFVRAQNTNGSWSLYEGRNFFVQTPVPTVAASKINGAEYFFDTDPGVGMGTAVATVTADSVTLSPAIPTGSLSNGFHNLFVRVRNTNGAWSLYEGRNFFIQTPVANVPAAQIKAAEYFIDTDPGQGHATAVSFTTADSINVNQAISTVALTPGFHNLFARAQNTNGSWSLYEGRNFFLAAPVTPPKPSPKLVAAEYFFDTDPGQGHGTKITGITAADSISITTSWNASALSLGTHKVFVRAQDSLGRWSLYEGRSFLMKNCSVTATATATNATCFAGTDGTATATASSGTKPYTYSWGTVPAQLTKKAVGLSPGTYTVTVTDSSGCPASAVATVGAPAAITINTTVIGTTCNQPNGQALVSASGGTGSYTYSWGTTPVQTGASVSGLAAGTYTIGVTDANHCSQTGTATIAPSAAPSLSVSTVGSRCGVAVGSASVTVSNGTSPYSYNWSNGSTLNHADSLRSGIYIVTVTDANHCSAFTAATISDVNGPVIGVNSNTPVACYGKSTGAISIAVIGGTAPYTYSWSNGSTSQNQTGLKAGPYQVSANDAAGCKAVQTINVTQSPLLQLSTSTTNSGCGVSTGTATAAVSGGTTPYTYSWSAGSGASTATAGALPAGVYSIKVTDANGCPDSTTAAVSNVNGPVVSIGSINNANCSNGTAGTVSLVVSGGVKPYTYSWSTGATTQNVSSLAAGTYTVKVTDSVACLGTASAVVSETLPPVISICEVTVDPQTKMNQVVWNKTTAKRIKSFNIYKESTSSGVYFLAATVPYSHLSVFTDSLANPKTRSWRYKISQVDSCGGESPLSPSHKTMHLTVNQGLSNTVNLIWDNYEGLTFGTYYVYRDTVATKSTLFDSIPNNIFTYTDANPLHAPHLYYSIGISNPGGCNPTMHASINYNSSHSNTGNLAVQLTGVAALNEDLNSFAIYPNPSSGVFNLSLDLMREKQTIRMRIFNSLGQTISVEQLGLVYGSIKKQIDLSGYSRGVYFVQLVGDAGIITRRIVIQ